MAYSFPEGSRFYFSPSTSFAAAKTISAVTNANPAVASSTSHGYSDNDEVVFTSGWDDATDTVWRVDQQTADTFQFLGLDSSDTDWFPAAGGTGTTAKISTWTEILQVLNISTSGGDVRYTNVEPLSRRNSLQVPTGFNGSSMNFTLGYDPTLGFYSTLRAASRALTPVALKIVVSGGGTAYGYGYCSMSEVPALNRNQPNTLQAAFSLLGRFISYTT